MSSVCSFLTMLERETSESNGNVRRMLSVCREFERIASVVLDKAEREMRGGRGKRKAADREKLARERRGSDEFERGLEEGKSLEQIQVETQASYRRPVQTPSLRMSQAGSIASESPASWGSPAGGTGPEYRTPSTSAVSLEPPPHHAQSKSPGQWNPHLPGYGMLNGYPHQPDFSGAYTSQPGLPHDSGAYSSAVTSTYPGDPLAGVDMSNAFGTSPDLTNATGSFQQPFVPQDLWQMPMTLEWDWAEGLGLGSFTPGPLFDGYALGGDGGGGAGDVMGVSQSQQQH